MEKDYAPSQKNIHAILQQRRLRHIHGICIRNLQQPELRDTKIPWLIHVRIFDKESSSGSATMLFKSEDVNYCSNPSWLGFCLDKKKMSKSNFLHLELWMQKSVDEEAKRVLVWSWNLLHLRYIAEKLYHGEITFVPNALILQIYGSFYSFAETFSTDTPHGNCPPFNLDEEKVSYNVFSIRRMVTSQKSIALSKAKSFNCISECENLMQVQSLYTTRCSEMENLKTKIKTIKLLLKRETLMLKRDTDQFEKLEDEVKEKHALLSSEQQSYARQQAKYDTIIQQSATNHQRTVALNRQLSSRRIEVLSELAYIFPIIPYTPPSGAKLSSKSQKPSPYQNFMICGIHLPHSESLPPKEDAKNAVAMGYVSQMLHMISSFLVIPLRYPLVLRGSQSMVIDNIIDKIQERDRIFPLYVRSSKERFLFEYGVYLLNKNIAQIRFLLGIPTSDLRPTLVNVKSLLELAIRNSQPFQPVAVQSVPRPYSNSPVHQQSPDIKNNPPNAATVSRDPSPSKANGVNLYKAQYNANEVRNKTAQLNNMREELFGKPNRNASNPVLPQVAASSDSQVLANAQQSSMGESILQIPDVTESRGNKNGASFLTGLEDLESDAKSRNDLQKPLDIVEARHELFKTKSGRPVIAKAKTYTMRSTPERQSNNDTIPYFKFRTSTSASSSSAESNSRVDHQKELSKSKTDVCETVQAVDGTSLCTDDLDLC